jgi:putative ABC transport system permease protein
MIGVWHDVRYGLRTFAKSSGFTSVAIISLALGIAAATVIFSIVDSVLLKPFPYKNVDRLATFHIHFTGNSDENDRFYFAAPEFLDFKQQNSVFEDMIGLAGANVLYSGKEGTRRFAGGMVTSNAFEILGIKPLLGRPITVDDGNVGSPPVFAMSYPLWVREFNRDPQILGATLDLNGEPRTLVAIMPPRFRFGEYCEIWIPVTLRKTASPTLSVEQGPWFWPLGVLKPGMNVHSVVSDFDVIARRLAKVYPGGYLRQFNVAAESFTDDSVGDARRLLFILMAAVAMLLLIACSNVANLLLSRSAIRGKEMGIRASIGATRARLIRQLLVESFILAAGGCVLGCSFAYFGLKAVVAIIPAGTVPSEVEITLNPAALSFALASTFLTTLLCGLAPAIHIARGPLYVRLTGSGKGNGGDLRHGKLRAWLVISEVAFSLILLIASGLMIRTLFALEGVQLGFDPANVMFAQLHHPRNYVSPAQKRVFLREVLDRVKTIPGVRFATEAITVPPYTTGLTDVIVLGREKPESSYAMSELISEDYFYALGIPLLRGRLFSRSESDSAQHMVVINQKFARSFFGGEDPIGHKIKFPSWETNYSDWPRSAYFEVIGVVADIKNKGLREPTMSQIYLPYTVTATGLADDRTIMVKTVGSPESVLLSIDKAIHELDGSVAVTDTGTIEKSLRGDYYAEPRFALTTVGAFGALGFVLVIVGIFSVMAYTVSLRTREFGIRMALGAQSGDVLRMVLKSGLALILAGTIIGSMISLALTRFLTNEIWGVSATDPWTFATVVMILGGTGLVACFLPARRASRVEPLIALRYE